MICPFIPAHCGEHLELCSQPPDFLFVNYIERIEYDVLPIEDKGSYYELLEFGVAIWVGPPDSICKKVNVVPQRRYIYCQDFWHGELRDWVGLAFGHWLATCYDTAEVCLFLAKEEAVPGTNFFNAIGDNLIKLRADKANRMSRLVKN